MINGIAKVCDGKTGECWEVKDSKGTPPVKKTKKPKTPKQLYSLKDTFRCSIIIKMCTDAYSPNIKAINNCIKEAKCELPKPYK